MSTAIARPKRPVFALRFLMEFKGESVRPILQQYQYRSPAFRIEDFDHNRPRPGIDTVCILCVTGMTMAEVENLLMRYTNISPTSAAETIEIAEEHPSIQEKGRFYLVGNGNRWYLPKGGIAGNPEDKSSPIYIYLDNHVDENMKGRSLHSHQFGEKHSSFTRELLPKDSYIAVRGDAGFLINL